MNRICKVILAAAAITALAAPAMAADKLIVKDTGAGNAFRVTDGGFVESKATTTGAANVSETYNNNVLRTNLRNTGIQEWYFNGGTSEVGKIAYSTPGGGVGFGLWTGATYDQNKFTMVNYGDNGAGVPVFAINYGTYTTGSMALTQAGLAIGFSWAPRSELEVSGTLMINDTPGDGAGYKVTKPTCNVNKDGGLFYTVGGAGVASKLELCQKAAGGTYSWVLVK